MPSMSSAEADEARETGLSQLAGLSEPPDDSVTGTPARRRGSIRRTAHINMVWPAGFGTALELRGRARDLLTSPNGEPRVVSEAEMVIQVGDQRTIETVSVVPDRVGVQALVGARGGERFRSAIDSALPGERESATPLYFLLDDVAGATLIAGFAWSQTRALMPPAGVRDEQARRTRRDGRIICSGLRPGGYYEISRERGGDRLPHFLRAAGPLEEPSDPWAWHPIEAAPAVCMRRRRRIDAWLSGRDIEVDLHFRDSLWDPDHTELAVHEYTVRATLEADTHVLTAITATPRVLPFPECPWAAPHASELIGQRVGGFRTRVQDTLDELRCCTHLNDALRGLAEVPVLAEALTA
jgi:Protein of unknown function (DUF2889)